MTLSALIERVEGATAETQASILYEALDYARTEGWLTEDQFHKAWRFLNVGAYVDAARMLLPKGYSREIRCSGFDHFTLVTLWDPRRSPLATDPGNNWCAERQDGLAALALVSACLRAWEARP